MKSNVSSFLCFSNYSPKPFKSPSVGREQSLFLKSLLTGKPLSVTYARVIPLVSPLSGFKKIKTHTDFPAVSEDTDLNEKGWYQNYE